MMIDFAIEAERKHGKSPTEAIHRGLPGTIPADHDDHHGGPHGHAADRARCRAQAPNRGGRWASRWSADSPSRSWSRCSSPRSSTPISNHGALSPTAACCSTSGDRTCRQKHPAAQTPDPLHQVLRFRADPPRFAPVSSTLEVFQPSPSVRRTVAKPTGWAVSSSQMSVAGVSRAWRALPEGPLKS